MCPYLLSEFGFDFPAYKDTLHGVLDIVLVKLCIESFDENPEYFWKYVTKGESVDD